MGADTSLDLCDYYKYTTNIPLTFTAALGAAWALTHLDLCDNRILDEGASHLALALRSCPSLRYLSLACNQIGEQGAARLAASMSVARGSVQGNPCECTHTQPRCRAETGKGGVGCGGGEGSCGGGNLHPEECAISGALPLNLEILDIRGNRVGAEGGRRLVEAAPLRCRVLLRY